MAGFGYPLIVAGSSASNGVALSTYRERLAPKLGFWGRYTVTSVLSGLEAERYAVSQSLRSDFAKRDRFDDLFLYAASGAQAGSQRAVAAGGFDGPNGAVMADYPFDAVLQSGSSFELSALPARDYLGLSGQDTCINLALEKLPVIHLVDLEATDQTTEYSLANYPWPIKGFGRVFLPRTTTNGRRVEMNGVTFVNDAELPVLKLPRAITAGQTFTVELLRPASTWIRQDNAWGDASGGLTSDDDQALYDAETVAVMALPIALERLALRYPHGSQERAGLEQKAETKKLAAGITRLYGRFRGSGVQRVGVR